MKMAPDRICARQRRHIRRCCSSSSRSGISSSRSGSSCRPDTAAAGVTCCTCQNSAARPAFSQVASHLLPGFRPQLHRHSAYQFQQAPQRLPQQLLAFETTQPGIVVGHAHIPHHTTQALHNCSIPLATCHAAISRLPSASDAGGQCRQQVQGCMPAAVSCISVADECLGQQGDEGGRVEDVQDVGAGGRPA